MRIVCNASPLILLAQTRQLSLLPSLFGTVMIPEAVWIEATQGRRDDSVAKAIMHAKSRGELMIFQVANRLAVTTMLGRLHIGEIETIIGACEINADTVILDDLLARKKAKQMRLNVTGTVGVLITAYRQGLVPDMKVVCESLRGVGFRISDDLLQRMLNESR